LFHGAQIQEERGELIFNIDPIKIVNVIHLSLLSYLLKKQIIQEGGGRELRSDKVNYRREKVVG